MALSRYGGVTGTEEISKDFENINVAFNNVAAENDGIKSDINRNKQNLEDHKSATNAHTAEHISYSGDVIGADNTKQALDKLKQELNDLVLGEDDSDPNTRAEVIAARDGNPTLGDRLNVSDEKLNKVIQVEINYNGVTRTFKNETTTFYVAPDIDSVSGFDGLSEDKPIKLSDIETVFNALKARFPVLLGNWSIKLSSGMYQGDGTKHMLYLNNIESAEWIEISGSDVSLSDIPTTILDGKINGSTYKHGMFFQNMNVKVSNIKFQNFTEGSNANITTGSRAGLACSGEKGRMWAVNIHACNCSWGGLTNQGIPRLYVQGGLFDNNRQGVVSMFNTQVSIGYQGSDLEPESENTRFINNIETGLLLQSQVNGHVDYCIFDGNTNRGIVVVTSSEVNLVKNTFRNNNRAISVQSNSRVLNGGNILTNNAQDFELFYGGYVQQTTNSDNYNRRRGVEQLLDVENTYFLSTAPSGGGVAFSQKIQPSSLYGRGKTLNMIFYGRLSNLGTNTSNILIKASDGINPVITLQTINVPSNSGYQNFKLETFLSNYNKDNFTYNSDFFIQATGQLISNSSGILLDSTREITISIELVVNGTASNTAMNIYRVLPRVVF